MSLFPEYNRKKRISYKRIQIVSIKVVKEGSARYASEKINSPEAAAGIAKSFLQGADREHFIALYLDTKKKITAIHTISIGTLDSSLVHPREVFKGAILSNAASIILAHNHPSGDATPSKNDIDVTRRLVNAGDILGIEVLDHIIIGEEKYVSLREEMVI